jgi:hypothetical protein
MPAVSGGGGEQHDRDARQRPADHRQEVDQRDPQRPQQRERHAEDQQVDEDDTPQMTRSEVPEHVPDDRLVDLGRDRLCFSLACPGESRDRTPRRSRRPLQEQQQHQDEDREQLEQQRQRALAERQGRRGEVLPERHQLRRVLLHPLLHVVALPIQPLPYPALAGLGRADVRSAACPARWVIPVTSG